MFNRLHHIAIICSDYQRSKLFYTEILNLKIINEIYRPEKQSWKLDLGLNGDYAVELFSFPSPPPRASYPEAAGLRHLAFEVDDIVQSIDRLKQKGVIAEPIRRDELTGKYFTFIFDPDHLPIELYQK